MPHIKGFAREKEDEETPDRSLQTGIAMTRPEDDPFTSHIGKSWFELQCEKGKILGVYQGLSINGRYFVLSPYVCPVLQEDGIVRLEPRTGPQYPVVGGRDITVKTQEEVDEFIDRQNRLLARKRQYKETTTGQQYTGKKQGIKTRPVRQSSKQQSIRR